MLHVNIKTCKSIIITIILHVGVYLVCREQRKKYLITETIGYPREPGGGGVVCQNHLLRNIHMIRILPLTKISIRSGVIFTCQLNRTIFIFSLYEFDKLRVVFAPAGPVRHSMVKAFLSFLCLSKQLHLIQLLMFLMATWIVTTSTYVHEER